MAVQTDDVRAHPPPPRLTGPRPPPGARRTSHPAGRRAALDGIRGLAIALVVVHHFTQALASRPRGGFLGVDVFFVLSGYLITGLLVRARERTGRVGLLGFWLRRARRLLPPLLLVVAAVSALSWWAFPPQTWPGLRSDALSALLYTANVHELGQTDPWGHREGPALLAHTWSLSVEEQFYLAWPLLLGGLLAAGHRLGRLRLPALWVSVAGGLLSFGWMARAWLAGSDAAAYHDTRARAGELLAGAALALALPAAAARLRPWARTTGDAAAAAGLVVLTGAVVVLAEKGNPYYLGGALVVSLAVVLVIAGVELAPEGIAARGLGRAPLAGLGRISYTLYLVHFPVMGLVSLPDSGGVPAVLAVEATRLSLSLGLAVLSYQLLERPLLAGTLPWVGRARGRLAAVALVAAAATVAVVVAATALPRAVADGLALPETACPRSSGERLTACDVGGTGTRWVVTGDESAAGLGHALAAVPGTAVTQAAWRGCGAGGLAAENPEAAPKAHMGPARLCARDALPLVAAAVAGPGTAALVVADATSAREALPAVGRDAAPAAAGTAGHDDLVRTALLRLVDLAAARGVPTVLVRQPPPTSALGPLVAAGRPAGLPPSLTLVTDLLRRYDAVLTEVAAQRPAWVRVVVVDDLVCPGGVCPAVLDGVLVRRTPREFTTAFAARLAPELAARVRAALTPPRRAE